MNIEPIETITGKGGLSAHIYQDEDASNPREDDNMGLIVGVRGGRHQLSDRGEAPLPDNLDSWTECEAYLRDERDAVVILPVFLYEHSAVLISTQSFHGRAHHAEWDSGQVGFIYATRKAILDNFMVKKLTKTTLAHTKKNLEGEIETFNQYISGDVYWYKIVRASKCDKCGHEEDEGLDSLGGLFGLEYAKKEAMSALEAAAKEKP